MKKLGKKLHTSKETLEAYVCMTCTCGSNCNACGVCTCLPDPQTRSEVGNTAKALHQYGFNSTDTMSQLTY